MTALFLKYRPQTFSDLVGQEAVKKTLKNALKAERPAHAYLFAGSRGTGKTSTARIFAKGLNCIDLQDGDPCGKCQFCVDTANGNLIDVIEIDAASNRGIDEIRDLREKITFMPNHAKRKVYIIDEVHMLTKEAFNALLKTLEEPPDHAYFCLATTEIHKIPETIISRCQTFIFERFVLKALVDRLAYIAKGEDIKVEKEALNLISQKAEGGMRDAISLLEQISAETESNITEASVRESLGLSSTELLNQFYDALTNFETEDGLKVLSNVAKTGGDFRTFGHDFLGFLRTKMFANLQNTAELSKVLRIIDEIEKALFRLKTSPIVELPLEIAVINITQNLAVPVPPTAQVAPIIKKVETVQKTEVIVTKKVVPQKNIMKPTPANEDDFIFDDEEPTQAAPIVETKKETVKVAVTQSTGTGDISNSAITQKLEEIVQKSGIPIFAKKSFLTTVPEVEGNKITFYTDSNFHREKLSSTEVLLKIKGAIAEIFGQRYDIDFVQKGGIKKAPKPNPEKNMASADDFLSF